MSVYSSILRALSDAGKEAHDEISHVRTFSPSTRRGFGFIVNQNMGRLTVRAIGAPLGQNIAISGNDIERFVVAVTNGSWCLTGAGFLTGSIQLSLVGKLPKDDRKIPGCTFELKDNETGVKIPISHTELQLFKEGLISLARGGQWELAVERSKAA